MTVGELVAHLSTLDQSLPALSDGYEGGLNDIEAKHITVELVAFGWRDRDPYMGDHERASDLKPWQLEYLAEHGQPAPAMACIIHRRTQHG